jgi:hypothetical protein
MSEEKQPKAATWWSFWRFKFWTAPPPSLKRSPIPSLGNLMPVDPKSWAIMQQSADWLAIAAVVANIVLVSVYAAIVASQSLLPMAVGFTDWIRIPIIVVFCLVAVATAVVMQFGTDFAIPFGAGLAGEKFRLAPMAAVLLWLICATTTVAMKVDVYTGWGRERVAEAAEKATVSDSDQRTLDKYRDVIPPPVASSDAIIAGATAEVARIEGERKTKAAARDQEEQQLGGRGPKWRELNDAVAALDTQLAAERGKVSAATAAKAARLEYDDADARIKATIREVTVSERQLLYDSDLIVWLRSVGMAFASFFFVLLSFMIRGARDQQARRSEAASKGVDTKRKKRNTFETEWEEAPPLDARAIPDFGDKPEVKPEAKPKPSPHQHPDKTGDDYGARNNGYEDNDSDAAA